MKHTLKKSFYYFIFHVSERNKNFSCDIRFYQISDTDIDLKDPTSIGLNLIGAHT